MRFALIYFRTCRLKVCKTGMCWGEDKCMVRCWWGNLVKRNRRGSGVVASGSGQGQVAGCCELGNKPVSCIYKVVQI